MTETRIRQMPDSTFVRVHGCAAGAAKTVSKLNKGWGASVVGSVPESA
jgi:hypothetical protein